MTDNNQTSGTDFTGSAGAMSPNERAGLNFVANLETQGFGKAIDIYISEVGDIALKEKAIQAREAFVGLPQDVAKQAQDAIIEIRKGSLEKSVEVRNQSFLKQMLMVEKLMDGEYQLEMKSDGYAATAVGIAKFIGTALSFIPGFESLGKSILDKAEELDPTMDEDRYQKFKDEIAEFKTAYINGDFRNSMSDAAADANTVVEEVLDTVTGYENQYSKPVERKPSPMGTQTAAGW